MHVAPISLYEPSGTRFSPEVRLFCDESRRVAQAILNPPSSSHYVGRFSRYPSATSYFSGPSLTYMPISIGNTTNNYYNAPTLRGRAQRDNEPSNATRVIVGMAAMAIGGWAIYKVGQSITNLREAKEEREDISHFERNVYTWEATGPNAHVGLMRKVVDCRKNIFERINNNAIWNLALLVGTVAAAVFALVGAFIASTGLMLAGAALGIAVGAAALFKAGYYSSSKETQDAWKLQTALDEIDTAKRRLV